MVYVGKWGDVKRPGSNVARYTKFVGKNRTQVVNLAIVRIKEEQDFIDNTLIKYVEVLHDLDLIEDGFYAQIKYGTDDERTICLIKNGTSDDNYGGWAELDYLVIKGMNYEYNPFEFESTIPSYRLEA